MAVRASSAAEEIIKVPGLAAAELVVPPEERAELASSFISAGVMTSLGVPAKDEEVGKLSSRFLSRPARQDLYRSRPSRFRADLRGRGHHGHPWRRPDAEDAGGLREGQIHGHCLEMVPDEWEEVYAGLAAETVKLINQKTGQIIGSEKVARDALSLLSSAGNSYESNK